MSTPFVKQIIAILETQKCAGWDYDNGDEGTVYVHINLKLAGADARAVDAYWDRLMREQEREFREFRQDHAPIMLALAKELAHARKAA